MLLPGTFIRLFLLILSNSKLITMYRIIFFLIVLCVSLTDVYAQHTLTVEVYGLRNNRGRVLLELSNEREEKVAGVQGTIQAGRSVIVIENLKPGKYGFRFFHDENSNEKLDMNFLGIPREGYGFSNYEEGTYLPPSFRKMLFDFQNSITMKVKPVYILN